MPAVERYVGRRPIASLSNPASPAPPTSRNLLSVLVNVFPNIGNIQVRSTSRNFWASDALPRTHGQNDSDKILPPIVYKNG